MSKKYDIKLDYNYSFDNNPIDEGSCTPKSKASADIQDLVVTITFADGYVDSFLLPIIDYSGDISSKANDNEVLHQTGSNQEVILGDDTAKPLSDFATSAQGQKADSAIQLADLEAYIDALDIPDGTDITGLAEDLQAHLEDFNNPHQVTKSQVGLSNVDNTSDANKPVSSLQSIAIANARNAAINHANAIAVTKVDKEAGKRLITELEGEKIETFDEKHYKSPVQSISDLKAIPESELDDKERRYVEDENVDYFYDQDALSGNESPDDQTNSQGFWKRPNTTGATEASELAVDNTDRELITDATNQEDFNNKVDADLQTRLQSVTGDGVDNTDPLNPELSFPDADEIDDSSTTNKFTNQTGIDKISNLPNDTINELTYKQQISTGAYSPMTPVVNSGDNTTFDVPSGTTYRTDFSDPTDPQTVKYIYPGSTGNAVDNLATHPGTYVGINLNTQELVQKTDDFTYAEYKYIAVIGFLVHTGNTQIEGVNALGNYMVDSDGQFHDFMKWNGIEYKGNRVTANGTGLQIDKAAGQLLADGINPTGAAKNILSLNQITAATFRYRLLNSTEYADTQSIDPNFFDNNGSRDPVPSNRWQNQRIVLFQSNAIRIQYGYKTYATADAATLGLSRDIFEVEKNMSDNGIPIAYLIIKEGVTNLVTALDNGNAYFIYTDENGNLKGGAGSGTSIGYTPEDVANKAIDFSTINNTLYPTTQATENRYTQIADFDDLEVRVSDNEDDIAINTQDIAELEANKEDKRTNKEVDNVSEYTVVASDFTDSQLYFTGVPSGSAIDVVVNENVCPNTLPSTGLQIKVLPQSKISFSGTSNLIPQPGATLTSANDGSSAAIIAVIPQGTVNDLGVFGTLESDGTGGGGLEEAPEDGTPYVRQDADWVSLPEGTANAYVNVISIDNVETKQDVIDYFNATGNGITKDGNETIVITSSSYPAPTTLNVSDNGDGTIDYEVSGESTVGAGFDGMLVGIQSGAFGDGGTALTLANVYEFPKGGSVIEANTDTGAEIDLSNVVGNNYNYDSPSSAETYTFINPVINGFARCFINAASEPTVTGGAKINTGDAFIPNTDMELCMDSPNGSIVEYYFLER